MKIRKWKTERIEHKLARSDVAATRKSKYRILIYGINYSPEPIGVGRYTGELGSYLVERGVEVDVVTAVPHYPGWALRDNYRNRYVTEINDNIRVTHCPLVLKSDMRGVWRLIAPLSFAISSVPVVVSRILVDRPDTLLCVEPTLLSAPVALLLAKLIGARTVLHVQDLEIDAAFSVSHMTGGLLKRLANICEGFILRTFDIVVTISNRMRDKLADKGVKQERLAVVRNWVDLSKIRPLFEPMRYRAELGLSDTDFVAMYAGNIGTKQALPIVFEAAERLRGVSYIKFVIVGDGPEKNRLMTRFGHLKNVIYLPVQPEDRFCELLNSANVHLIPQHKGVADLVLPSKLGGILASGRPCIVMADPGTELYDFVGREATVIPPGDSAWLADAIVQLRSASPGLKSGKPASCLASLNAVNNLSSFHAILVDGHVS